MPCFAFLVLLLATTKIYFEEHALLVGPKQSSQADKADRLTSQAGWEGCHACLLCFVPAYFVLCLLLELAFPSRFCTNIYTLSNILYFRYL